MLKTHLMSLVSKSHHLIAAWLCSRNKETVCSHSELLYVWDDQCPYNHRTVSPFAASKILLKCKIAELGRKLWKSPSPAQGQKEPMASVQSDFQYLQGWRLHNLSLGNLYQCFATLTGKKKIEQFFHYLPVRRAWLHLLYFLSSCTYTYQ